MSRIAAHQDNARQQGTRSTGLNTISTNNRGTMKNHNSSRRSTNSNKVSSSKPQSKSSHTTRRSSRFSGAALETEKAAADEDGEDELTDLDDVEDALLNSRPARSTAVKSQSSSSRNNGSLAVTKSSSHTNSSHSPKRKQERKKEERKASVRKEKYDLDATDSELSDAPEVDKTESHRINGGDDDDDQEEDLNLTESDSDMAERLQAAGDGESLLGSAISDREDGDTDKEEERFIIEDAKRKSEKANARRQRDGSTPTRKPDIATHKSAAATAGRDDDDPYPDNGSGSLSPQTLQQLGLDELFEGFDGLQSSSEPSFTDFFMSESEDGTDDDGIELEPLPDDDQLTTDDEDDDSGSDISDLEEGLLSAPFLADALAAGAGTQLISGNGTADAMTQADIPLLVIEDLDGRLIYARAGDGEAVFGSDGEFEFVDDSEEDSDEEDEIHFPMDGFNGTRWTHWRNDDEDETDEGETTDEFPHEDMPFPRLLVGSVAPHGGRNARRARVLAARSRRISPSGLQARSRESSAVQDMEEAKIQQSTDANENGKGEMQTNANPLHDVDFSISTEDLARDPKATLEAAAKSLGLTVDEVAQLVIGTAESTGANGQNGMAQNAAYLSPEIGNNLPLPGPMTPEQQKYPTFRRAPLMGCFIPSSSKGVHRAFIDGSNQAPSPFANRFGTQRKGLAPGKKRQPSQSTPSAKRLRRESNTSMALQSDLGESVVDVAAPIEEHAFGEEIDEMDLDDVMDASMMWRGPFSSSPTQAENGEKVGSFGKKSPAVKPTAGRRSSAGVHASTSPEKSNTGLNMSAVARWHRIPMGAFRDSQVTSSQAGPSTNSTMANHQQQPLGSFLLTRSRGAHQRGIGGRNNGGNARSHAEHSPFRGRSTGDSIHLGPAPEATSMRDAFIVSPILWPSNGSGKSINGGGNNNTVYGGISQTGHSSQSTQATEPTMMRKMTTRREKRERKARRDALKAALRAVDGDGEMNSIADGETQSPSKNGALNGSNSLESPSTALPRLSITDASPSGSPLLSKSKTLGPSGLSKEVKEPSMTSSSADGAFVKPDIAASAKQSDKTKTSPIDIPSSGLSSSPSSSMVGIGIVGGGSNNNGNQNGGGHSSSIVNPNSLPSTSPSSSLSSQHQPPSSVFGMPLHSPLFGSILNPTNLGFRDDLDERDEEGILTI